MSPELVLFLDFWVLSIPRYFCFCFLFLFDQTSRRQVQRYLDDIFTIDNPEFAEHIPDIYPKELQLNTANTSDKETSFLDLNIKVIGSNIHTSVYDNTMTSGFL